MDITCSIGATIDGDAAQRTPARALRPWRSEAAGAAARASRGEPRERLPSRLRDPPRAGARSSSDRAVAAGDQPAAAVTPRPPRRVARTERQARRAPRAPPRAAPGAARGARRPARRTGAARRAPAGAVASAAAVGAADLRRARRASIIGADARRNRGSPVSPPGSLSAVRRHARVHASASTSAATARTRRCSRCSVDRASLRPARDRAARARRARARLLRSSRCAVDVPLFAFLFKLLRARFLEARRERAFAGRSLSAGGLSSAGSLGGSSSEGSGRSPSAGPSPRVSPAKPRRSRRAISRSPSTRAGCRRADRRSASRCGCAAAARSGGWRRPSAGARPRPSRRPRCSSAARGVGILGLAQARAWLVCADSAGGVTAASSRRLPAGADLEQRVQFGLRDGGDRAVRRRSASRDCRRRARAGLRRGGVRGLDVAEVGGQRASGTSSGRSSSSSGP